MTTRSSPIQALKAQADKIARVVKATGKDTCKFAVVMDDKILSITAENLNKTSEKNLAKYILDQMQEV